GKMQAVKAAAPMAAKTMGHRNKPRHASRHATASAAATLASPIAPPATPVSVSHQGGAWSRTNAAIADAGWLSVAVSGSHSNRSTDGMSHAWTPGLDGVAVAQVDSAGNGSARSRLPQNR